MDIVGEIAVSANIKLSTAAKQFIDVTGVKDIDLQDIKEMVELQNNN